MPKTRSKKLRPFWESFNDLDVDSEILLIACNCKVRNIVLELLDYLPKQFFTA